MKTFNKRSNHKPKLAATLPKEDKYRTWSPKKIRDLVTSDAYFMDRYVTKRDKYKLSDTSVAVYNFAKKPLLGKYKSCVFDVTEGILLCKQSASIFQRELVNNGLFPDIATQIYLHESYGFKHRHILLAGKNAFFSTFGISTAKGDLISLQYITDTAAKGVKRHQFIAGELNYKFEFNCSIHLTSKLRTALHYYERARSAIENAEYNYAYPWYINHSILGQHNEVDNDSHLTRITDSLHRDLLLDILAKASEQELIYNVAPDVDFDTLLTRHLKKYYI